MNHGDQSGHVHLFSSRLSGGAQSHSSIKAFRRMVSADEIQVCIVKSCAADTGSDMLHGRPFKIIRPSTVVCHRVVDQVRKMGGREWLID